MKQIKQRFYCSRLNNRNVIVLLFVLMCFFVSNVAAEDCRIKKIVWMGDHYENDDAQMSNVVGKPCNAWKFFKDKLVTYYENQGFIAISVYGNVDEFGVLSLKIDRGLGWVWANPENLDSSGTKLDVFRRLTGIESGTPVSLSDLERSERKLLRMGYYEQSAPTRLFRDATRNRIIPAFSMRKANISEAEGVLTYSSEENSWEGLLNVSLYNIAGTARDLLLEGFTGEKTRHIEGYYKEPWILGSAWNIVFRGSFDEEIIESEFVDDTTDFANRLVVFEMGVTSEIGFDFTMGVFFGFSEFDKRSSLEMTYFSLDRFILPRRGYRLESSLIWKMDRPDSLDNYLSLKSSAVAYFPLYRNFIVRYTGAVGGIFPTDADLMRLDLFALGGLDDFKGVQYHTIRSRAYGLSEFALMWQDGYDLSIELFYLPGVYRRHLPGHGWAREQNYGIGFTQYHKNWSVNLYYALRNNSDYLEGILGFGVKSLF